MAGRGLLLFSAMFLIGGCSEPDYGVQVDAKVNQEWMRPGMFHDAIEYLESGGRYYNGGDAPGAVDLDRQAIVPLLKGLKREFGTEQYAILLEDQDFAWGIVMKLPQDSTGEERVEAFLEDARQSFPGMIIEEWGHEWLSLDFIDEEEAAMVRKARAAAKAAS